MLKALYIVNRPDYFLSHRVALAQSLAQEGYEIHIASVKHESTEHLYKLGFHFHFVDIERGRTNPFKELLGLISVLRLVKQLKPDIVHCITVKPVLYGGLAARLLGTPKVVVAIAGLGSVFTTDSVKNSVLRFISIQLYKMSLGNKNLTAIFQNKHDRSFFVERKIIPESRTRLIRGSGVDLDKFALSPMPVTEKRAILLSARLLREKGVFEFLHAAKLVLQVRNDAEFWLAGDIDPANPSSLTKQDVDQWSAIEGIKFLGFQSDIYSVIKSSEFVVLPSYREGFPKALIEAAAVGRAIITTDVPGCEDAVINNKTGFLVPVKQVEMLVEKILFLLDEPEKCAEFGRAGRVYAENNFDLKFVVQEHKNIYLS
ncbi:Glycosyltransferase involved in cell wall bisynthesis [Arsukibacterium tuosuense]|uniref:Glycosyltransferase involved in cell wall bisynthesis n=1 Tax=Arsukibacterium tuosuense TaxID=1323745 RepID=A0A285IXN0_9GAMM|nr:glycosyltransferase family 4 protein [Arsukibacterium tuosuense]SNY51846.1 Glycosyltransferase involved in cell wall bisynthesis [Arsukibacterium tuosuense]